MRIRIALRTVCLIGALSLMLPAAAAGKPAGDEYLPKVPKSAGEAVTAGDEGPGATILAPEVRGRPKKKKEKPDKSAASTSAPLDQTSSDEDSGGALDTLLDPVVLLLIAGVMVTALGMTMRRRQALAGDPDAEGSTRELGSAPPTPDGEIIGREPPA